jgi:hypothetical protein
VEAPTTSRSNAAMNPKFVHAFTSTVYAMRMPEIN